MQKLKKIFSSKNFLLLTCSSIFLLSIFLRSIVDIGADTGFYLDLGKRIAEGKKYYYNFFESNFPLSFYFYALQYKISVLSGISQIIMSEIFINILAILSIFSAAKILQRSAIYEERRDHYNVIIISFCLGFFLRITALEAGEFGTKTSLLLLLLYPYLAYSFLEKEKFTKQDLIFSGALMGLIPCLKPHYAILIIVIEFSNFWKKKSPRFFLEIDKLICAMILAAYLNFMLIFTPEYFEFMVPMWRQFYAPYADKSEFFNNLIKHLTSQTLLLFLISPIFLRLNFSKTDKILSLIFCGAALLLALENIGTIDQEAIFYALATIVLLKFSYDFFSSKYFSFKENKFIILTLVLIPAFDITNFFTSIFNLINIWFLIFPLIFIFSKKQRNIFIYNFPLYFILTSISILFLTKNDKNLSLLINLISFFIFFVLYEKSYTKLNSKFSPLLIFVVVSINSYFAYLYISSIKNTVIGKNYFSSPSSLTDDMAHNVKLYAPSEQDSYLVVSNWIAHQFPLMNYLEKKNNFKYAVAMIYDAGGSKTNTIFSIDKPDRAFVFNYLLDDFKKQLQNKDTKIVFVNQGEESLKSKTKCNIRLLEYYFQDLELRKIFMQNFHFQNRIIKYKEKDAAPRLMWKKEGVFDAIKPSKEVILHDFEVYVRN